MKLRGNGGADIFQHDDDRRRFEALVAEGVKRFEHLIHAYCWMTNHIHCVLRRDAATLSNGLRRFEARLSRDPVLRERVRALRERILRGEQGGAPPYPAGNDPPS